MHTLLRAGLIKFLVLTIVCFLLFGSYFFTFRFLLLCFLVLISLLFAVYFLLLALLKLRPKDVTTIMPSRVRYLRTLEAHRWPVV
jgi:hypothetical protein